jgi:hypothetical protein
MIEKNVQHVYPLGDLKEHDIDQNCWCKPELEVHGYGMIVIHSSLDGRELYEQNIRRMN